MRSLQVFTLTIVVATSSAGAVSSGGQASARTQCRAGEAVAYSCQFGKKVASVCATGASVAYRYGPVGSPEIEIVSSGRDGLARRSFVVGQGHGREDHVRFSKGDYSYVVHSGVAGELSDIAGHTWSGVVVMQGEAEFARLDCRQNSARQRLKDLPFVDYDADDRFNMWF
jgi:hypothetical protein